MTSPARHLALALACVALIGSPRSASAYVYYIWKTGVSGPISDSTKWNPAGVPLFADRMQFSASGTYTVNFPTTHPTTSWINVWGGAITFKIASTHTTGPFYVSHPNSASHLTMDLGTLFVDYLHLGDLNAFSTLRITQDSRGLTCGTVRSKGSGNPNPSFTGDQIGGGGISELYLTNGGRYYCDSTGPASGNLAIGAATGSSATVSIAGSGGSPVRASLLASTGGGSLIVGARGTANVFVTNSGALASSGNLFLGIYGGSQGYLTVGSASNPSNAYLGVEGDLFIGGNEAVENDAGLGVLTVEKKGIVTVVGACEIGDSDNDTSSVLRVRTGGTFTAQNGMKVWPTSGLGMDLQGGLTQITGGVFEWPAGKYLAISSTTGSPQFLIENGTNNVGPSTLSSQSQLLIGRGGTGSMTLRGSNTVFTMGAGATTIGEMAGGSGSLQLDSGAGLSTQGLMAVGSNGQGSWNIHSGATAHVDKMAVGVAASGSGLVDVEGAGSSLTVQDNLWIGGGFGGPGGVGEVRVRSGAQLEVQYVNNGVNPALTTVFPLGELQLLQGSMSTPHDVFASGVITLTDGELNARNVVLTAGTGRLRGHGNIHAAVQNAGVVTPGLTVGQTLPISIADGYTQLANGHYEVDLGESGGLVNDVLVVEGPAVLAGALDLRPENGFVGTPGDVFRVIECESVQGTFDAVTWAGQPLDGEVNLVYGDRFVAVVVAGEPTGIDDPAVTTIAFRAAGDVSHPSFALDLPGPARVCIKAYDLRGREIATLFEGPLPASRHSIRLERNGRRFASGVYFARAEIDAQGQHSAHTVRVVLVR